MSGRVSLRCALLVTLALLVSVVLVTPAGADFGGTPCAAQAPPYGTNDAGGFRNVLPPGENGLDTLKDVFTFKAVGTPPPHYADQQPLYENLALRRRRG